MISKIFTDSEYTDQIFDGIRQEQTKLESLKFFDCTFVHCSFSESTLQNTRFSNCHFKRCDLSLVHLPACRFSATRFEDTKMIGVNWTVADWAATYLGEPMAFNRCDISHSTFIGLSIREIKIIDCKAFNVDFREADLSLADFSGTDLTESIFMNSNLSEATFLRARNYDINPGKNNLTQAKFSLPEAISLLYSLEIEIGGLEEQGHDLENADRPPADTQRKSND